MKWKISINFGSKYLFFLVSIRKWAKNHLNEQKMRARLILIEYGNLPCRKDSKQTSVKYHNTYGWISFIFTGTVLMGVNTEVSSSESRNQFQFFEPYLKKSVKKFFQQKFACLFRLNELDHLNIGIVDRLNQPAVNLSRLKSIF